ncbi:hypothetical protein DBR32_05200 [Taibaiella sp. KBW10]|uniref:hypothetical protein n=1 Tax=Taibaiella sp. KBW10 TaxID=2153357 RepID=UPI000F5A9BDD|nr:hypothetical protein [Taibaiella sp. KBW10]RQO31362.1 hypothetical protein DBR32_05200 [Taibaiella sp. KBW10]
MGIMLLQGMPAVAQDTSVLSNLISRRVVLHTDTLQLDSLSIGLGSFYIDHVPAEDYSVNYTNSTLVWNKNKPIPPDSVTIHYRRLPLSLARPYYHKKANLIDHNVVMGGGYRYDGTMANGNAGNNFVNFNAIDYNGNYGRSLSVGNNQDIVLNSQFNLQLNGYILDSVRIEAAITDNNIPFQPDGNTQRLQEFDKMYVTFEKGRHKLTVGDYNMDKPNSYFLNFNKRVQGIAYDGVLLKTKNIQNTLKLDGSVAKGQFTRNIFQGIEGNQGPYKLQGDNGEQYFIVLAGTERVFIDGELMARGEDLDYVINYNTAELIFMPRRLITKDKRIQVDFEYQSRNYLNTLFFVSDELKIGSKWTFRFNAYSNQDAKNQTYVQTLSADQKRFLGTIGDNIDQAFYATEKLDTFAGNKILYRKTDSVVNGITYPGVYVYTTNPNDVVYSLNFSYVGEGNGDYVISGLNTNGRSYAWVAPLNGLKQGNYEPKALLITPKLQQVFTTGAHYQIDSLKQVSMEWSSSNYSPNTFSSIDNALHWGSAGKLAYEETRLFGKDSLTRKSPWKWNNKVSYEYVDARFVAIAPYRNIEFNRDWNIAATDTRADEHLVTLATNMLHHKKGNLGYDFTFYKRGTDYTANRHQVSFLYNSLRYKAGLGGSAMNSVSPDQKSIFLRPTFFAETVTGRKSKSTIGFRFEKEYNELKNRMADTLLWSAYNFDISKLYFKTAENQPLNLNLNYAFRRDFAPAGTAFKQSNRGHTVEANLNVSTWKNHQLSLTGSYRLLQIDNSLLSKETAGSTLLGRINYSGNIAHGFLVPSLVYDFGTGQEQKRQFTYVEVAAGQGTYMWIDYNNDGVQQANEFEIAIYKDQKRFIRLITPTNEYVKVNFANLNLSLQLNPDNLWRNVKERKGIQKFVSRFSDQLALQINNRTLYAEGLKSFNPFATNFEDTSIISGSTALSNTIFYNRSSARWGLDYTTVYSTNKSLLTYGLEGQSLLRHNEKLRWVLNRNYTFMLATIHGNKQFSSPLDDGRSYFIRFQGVEPSLLFLYNSKMRITASYKLEHRQNKGLFGGEFANVQNISIDSRLSFPSSGSIQFRGTYSQIQYNGLANTSLSFVMLDALAKGANWLWYLNWTTRINKSIEFSLEYDGRKPGTNPAVHTGTMSVRAIL